MELALDFEQATAISLPGPGEPYNGGYHATAISEKSRTFAGMFKSMLRFTCGKVVAVRYDTQVLSLKSIGFKHFAGVHPRPALVSGLALSATLELWSMSSADRPVAGRSEDRLAKEKLAAHLRTGHLKAMEGPRAWVPPPNKAEALIDLEQARAGVKERSLVAKNTNACTATTQRAPRSREEVRLGHNRVAVKAKGHVIPPQDGDGGRYRCVLCSANMIQRQLMEFTKQHCRMASNPGYVAAAWAALAQLDNSAVPSGATKRSVPTNAAAGVSTKRRRMAGRGAPEAPI
jgi:hypothetical protein